MKTMKHLIVGLVVSVLFLQLSGCKKDEAAPPPTITDFSPLEAPEGATITINGTNFSQELSKNSAFVGFASAEIVSATSTQLIITVPKGATTGSIRVVVNGNAATTQTSFIVLSQPTITSIQPSTAKAGDVVTINGMNFSSDPTKNAVTFPNGAKATITSATNTNITIVIPKEAATGSLTITTPGGLVSSPVLNILMTVESISPLAGPIGTRIKITGTGFNFPVVYFVSGTRKLSSVFLSSTSTEMIVTPPSGATTGSIILEDGSQNPLTTAQQFVVQDVPPVEKAPFPGPVRSFGGVGFTIGEQIYVGLGEDINNSLTDFWRYSPATNSWTQMTSFPSGGRTRAIGFAANGKGYICGGIVKAGTTTTLSNELWEYDPSLNTWTKRADFPGAARSRATAFVLDNNAYVGTGSTNSTTYFKDFWQYNPVTNTWVRKADFGGKPVGDAAGFTISGSGYISGGYGSASGDGYETWRYDPAKDSWTKEFFATPFFPDFDKCFGFAINGIGYVGKGSRLFQFVPVPNRQLPDASTGLWVDVQTAPSILTPLPGGATGIRNASSGIYLANSSKAFVWYGTDKFWEFTPPN